MLSLALRFAGRFQIANISYQLNALSLNAQATISVSKQELKAIQVHNYSSNNRNMSQSIQDFLELVSVP